MKALLSLVGFAAVIGPAGCSADEDADRSCSVADVAGTWQLEFTAHGENRGCAPPVPSRTFIVNPQADWDELGWHFTPETCTLTESQRAHWEADGESSSRDSTLEVTFSGERASGTFQIGESWRCRNSYLVRDYDQYRVAGRRAAR